jgi:hypothetical protein
MRHATGLKRFNIIKSLRKTFCGAAVPGPAVMMRIIFIQFMHPAE